MHTISKKLFFIVLSLMVSHAHALETTVIQAHNIEESVWKELKDLFVDTFSQAYNHVDIKDIHNNFDTTAQYLQSLFDTDRKNINDLHFDVIVATEQQEIIGYILSCYCPEEKAAYIHHLVVDSRKHNKGIGRKLIKACEDLYKEACFISLSTRAFNDKAIGFYKHIGFYEANYAPEIAYIIRPNAKNNPQVVNLEKVIDARDFN